MAIFVQQYYQIDFYGDGVTTSVSYDLSKAPFSSGFVGVHGALQIGNPNSVASGGWQTAPQIGIDGNTNPIFDYPSITVGLQGVATLNVTFGAPLKLYNSIFSDGVGGLWQIGYYTLNLAFRYNG